MVNRLKETDIQILDGKIFAVLSYLSILCIIPLVFKRDNGFVLDHAKQGLVIFIGQVAVFIAHIVLGSVVLRLGLFILGLCSLWGMIEALKGKYTKLPIIADIAAKITL